MEPIESGSPSPKAVSMACLQIAVGIMGTLLFLLASLISRWSWSAPTAAGVVALWAGVLLAAIGGILGLKPERQRRSRALMAVGDIVLTLAAIAFLVASRDGTLSWYFPIGILFLTLAVFSDVASYKFSRAVMAR